MGLNNSPSQLNLILSNIYSDKTRFHSLACYVDDLLIYTNDWKTHIEQLEVTLKTLEENRISCNLNKTEIGYQEVGYLGHPLSADSVRVSKKRIEAIRKISAPKNIKALQRLLGMLNYWKKYIPAFSKNTYNMRQLLKKEVPFVWTPACEVELQYLKNRLVSDPVLKPIDPNRDLTILTDASTYGIGFTIC